MRVTKYIVFLLLFIVFISCSSVKETFGLTQYDRIYPLYQTCVRKDNIWGDWERKYSFKVRTEYNKWGLVIYLYYGNHPSNYDIKIMIDKSSQKEIDEEWVSYNGSVVVSKTNVIDYGMLEDTGQQVCTILCDKQMNRAIKKNGLVGTLNILYNNGTGRGFTFWHNANY